MTEGVDIEALEREAIRQQQAEIEERKRIRETREAKAREAEAKIPKLPNTGDIRAAARAVEMHIFQTYYDMMIDPETPAAVRKSCADSLADRARGKAGQEGKRGEDDEDNQQDRSITILKNKILKAIPDDQLDTLLSAVHQAGSDQGEESP